MSVIVAEGKVVVEADATGIPKQISDDIEKGKGDTERAGNSVGRSVFGGVVGAWAAIGGTQLVTSWFTGAVGGASDLNETLSKSTTIFGKHQASIESFSNNAATNLGLSKEAAMAAAAGFGDMFTQIGFGQDQAAAFSQSVITMAADLGSFSNLDTADVAERMSAAFRGEYDSLQAVIPGINAARVEHEAMASGLVKTTVDTEKLANANIKVDLAQRKYNDAVKAHGANSTEALSAGLALSSATEAAGKAAEGTTEEISAQARAQAVMSIMAKDAANAQGDFAKTSDGAANAAKIATASLEDQQTKIGAFLLPAWSGFLGFLNDTAIPAFSGLVTWIGENTSLLAGLGLAVGVAAGAWLIMTGAMAAYNGVMAIMRAVTIAGSISQWALNVAMAANPVGIVIGLLALLVGAIVWVATQTTFFQDVWTNVTNAIGTAWNWLWTTVLSPVFTAIGNVFAWIYNSIIVPIVTGIMIYVGLWAAVFTWFYGAVVAPVFAAIGVVFRWVYTSVILPIVGYIQAVIRGLGVVFTWLNASVVQPVVNAVGAAFRWVYASVILPVANFISSAIRTVGGTISSVFGGISGFIGNAFKSVLGAIRGPINGIIGLVNRAIGSINSLSVTIPSWVPIVGGQTWGLNIPKIPMLARGALSSPDTFIAGENGPELITGARGSRVYPARDTAAMAGRGDGRNVEVYLTQEITATDPILGARQAAREVTRYFGV